MELQEGLAGSGRLQLGILVSITRLVRFHAFGLVLCLFAVEACAQNTIRVPADQPTIQAAIDISAQGDTILVSPGTYKELISFQGKAITVTSVGGAASTILDGGQSGVVVSFTNNEMRTSVLNGFTITDDAPPLPTQTPFSTDGILVTGSSPTITNNIVNGNRGFGIEVNQGAPLIQGNTIANTATAGDPRFDFGCDYDDGSAISITGSVPEPVQILGNRIENNKAQCYGGAIQIYAATGPIVENNVIDGNFSLGFGGAISLVNGDELTVIQNLIYNNTSGTAGGALYLGLVSGANFNTGPVNLFIVNNTIFGNSIVLNPDVQDAWVDGSQVAFGGYVSQTGFYNNIIVANTSTYGAIACNTGYEYLSGSPPFMDRNDVLNLAGASFSGWCPDQTGSDGNISADPKFSNPSSGDFQLQSGSPAIDAGDNSAPNLPAMDIDSNIRIQNATGLPYPVIDLGATEAPGPANLQATQASLSVLPLQLSFGASVNMQANITAPSSITSGTVGFFDSTILIGQSQVSPTGAAAFTTSTLKAGTHSITAAFSGSSSLAGSVSSPTSVVVIGEPTTATLTASPTQGTFPQSVTLTATVTSPYGTPTGNVEIYIGDKPVATVPLNSQGVAEYVVSNLNVGAYSFFVQYSIQGPYAESISPTVNSIVQQAPTTVTLTVNPNPATPAQTVMMTATVQSAAGIPTGIADFNDGSLPLRGEYLNSNGIASITESGLIAGTHSISVQYINTDGNFAQSMSQVVNLTVNPLSPDFSIAPSSTSMAISSGLMGSATITVTPVNNYAGSITFSCSGLPATSTCSFSPAPLTPVANNEPLTTTLTISAASTGLVAISRERRVPRLSLRTMVACAFLLLAVLLIISAYPRTGARWRRGPLLKAFCVSCLLAIISCGGSSAGSGQPPTSTSTIYTVVVTALGTNSSGSISHSINLSVTVSK